MANPSDVRRGWIVRFDGEIAYVAGVHRSDRLLSVLVLFGDRYGGWFSENAWNLNFEGFVGLAQDCHICNAPPTRVYALNSGVFWSECAVCGAKAVFHLR